MAFGAFLPFFKLTEAEYWLFLSGDLEMVSKISFSSLAKDLPLYLDHCFCLVIEPIDLLLTCDLGVWMFCIPERTELLTERTWPPFFDKMALAPSIMLPRSYSRFLASNML
jgi:hypothetical protein